MTPEVFRRKIFSYYRAHGRHDLPWRRTRDPYQILVSEVMLQQTQVDRVVPFYREFLKRFPTVRALAGAPLSEVLRAWQGLGYNRRAKMLHEAARVVAQSGRFPRTIEALEDLPGVGPYTARAVAAFAYNTDSIFIETNIRTVVTHHFFANRKKVTDAEILTVLEASVPKGKAREWYAALMDYGAYLKRAGVKVNAKSAHYTKQKRFGGSDREARGAILRELTKTSATKARLLGLLGDGRRGQLERQLAKLEREGLVVMGGRVWRLAE